MLLLRLVQAFQKEKIPFAVVGGYAVALHGVVRGTVDVDLILSCTQSAFEKAEEALKRMGFVSRLPVTAHEVYSFREEYIKNRNLVAWSFYHSERPAEVVDIVLTEDLKSLRVEKKNIHGVTIPVLSIEDLIQMKQRSGRPQDKEDIKAMKYLLGDK